MVLGSLSEGLGILLLAPLLEFLQGRSGTGSGLDMENETRVREAIEGLHGDLTVVIIRHRLPTLQHADQVVVRNWP